MAFRFRKSKSIFPGVRINLTPKGFGISAGTKGMRVSRSATGQSSLSAGVPGSGISYRKQIKKQKHREKFKTYERFIFPIFFSCCAYFFF